MSRKIPSKSKPVPKALREGQTKGNVKPVGGPKLAPPPKPLKKKA